MTDPSAKRAFPRMSAGAWWKLREKFQASVPRGGVTASYLATVLAPMKEGSARANVLNPLKAMGLINDDGTPTELVESWRSNNQADYEAACAAIRERVYPPELLDALPPPQPDTDAATNWFMRNAGVGTSGAKQMAATYKLLCEADLSKQHASAPRRKSTPTVTAPKKIATSNQRTEENIQEQRGAMEQVSIQGGSRKLVKVDPSVHIDIQIHISPESSDKQIETIFANMAKHLYGSKSSSNE